MIIGLSNDAEASSVTLSTVHSVLHVAYSYALLFDTAEHGDYGSILAGNPRLN